MAACPICNTASEIKRKGTPYFVCSGCGTWWQDPMPEKCWHGPHEGDPTQMSDGDKAINAELAGWLLKNVLRDKPGKTLDVGASFPYLAECLHKLGCFAMAIDGSGELETSGLEIDGFVVGDFEQVEPRIGGEKFDLITFIHSWEHLYRPLDAVRKVRQLLADDGALFIRMPDNTVPGHERDLTDGHYEIHPFFHSLSSVVECCAQTGCFRIEWQTELRPGQRDMILRPL